MSVIRTPIDLAKATFKGFFEDEATWKAAALAYYTVFALPPLLVLLLEVASALWDPVEVRRTITGEFQAMMGQDVAGQIQTMIASAEERTSGKGWRLALSIGGLVFGATGAFAALQNALNRAWKVEPDPKRGGIRNFVTKRFLSLGMVLGLAFLMLVSLALTSALTAAGDAVLGGFPKSVGLALNFVFSFLVIAFLFAAMFKVLPDAKIGWRDVWVGGTVTAVLFMLGKFLIGLYIGQSDPGDAFGGAGALAVLLVWIYYAAIIVLLGAEFTQAWVKHHGGRIEPEEGAVHAVERKEHIDKSGRRTQAEPAEEPAGAPTTGKSEAHMTEGSKPNRAPRTKADVHRHLETTRQEMSRTVNELEARVAESKQALRQRVDVVSVVREHPWSAIGAAIVAGVALGASNSDERAASAALAAAKRAPDAAAQAARSAADGVTHLARSVRNRNGGGADEAETSGEDEGFMARTRARLMTAVNEHAHRLGDDLGRAVDEAIGGAIRGGAGTGARGSQA